MVIVYALYNKINSKIYIGITIDIKRRLKEHNAGKNRYTKAFMPWMVFFKEQSEDYSSARKRELYFKSTKGRRELKRKLIELNLLNTE